MKNFPNVITANNAQDSVRIIQDTYQSRHGVKLKRSSLLIGMSNALKFANLNTLQATQGTISIHKDVPVWIGVECLSDSSADDEPTINTFVATSEQAAKEKLIDSVIEDLLDTCGLDLVGLLEELSTGHNWDKMHAVVNEELSIDTNSPWMWSATETSEFCNLIKDVSFEYKMAVFNAIANSESIRGDWRIECISDGIEPVPTSPLLSVFNSDDGLSVRLEGTFLYNLVKGLNQQELLNIAFDGDADFRPSIPDFEKKTYGDFTRVMCEVIPDHDATRGTTVALKIVIQYEGDRPWKDRFTEAFISNSI